MSAKVTTTDVAGVQREVFTRDLQWRPAAYAFIIKDNKVLLTKQHGGYHLPGGGVELGEVPEETVLREVYEETGVVADKPKLLDYRTTFFSYADERTGKAWHFQSLLFYFQCHFVSGELSLDNVMDDERPHSEMPEWVSLDKLDKIKAGSTVDWVPILQELVGT